MCILARPVANRQHGAFSRFRRRVRRIGLVGVAVVKEAAREAWTLRIGRRVVSRVNLVVLVRRLLAFFFFSCQTGWCSSNSSSDGISSSCTASRSDWLSSSNHLADGACSSMVSRTSILMTLPSVRSSSDGHSTSTSRRLPSVIPVERSALSSKSSPFDRLASASTIVQVPDGGTSPGH